MDKKNIFIFLIVLIIIVLSANIIYDKYFSFDVTHKIVNYNEQQVLNRFYKAFENFAMNPSWIKKQSFRKKNKQVSDYFKIDVPEDLPIPLLINELKNLFESSDIFVDVTELKKGGKTEVVISNYEKNIITAVMDYSSEIKRKSKSIALVINDFTDLDGNQMDYYLDNSEHLSFKLFPSKQNEQLAEKIIKNKKEYFVLLDDNITDLKYKLKGVEFVPRLKSIIRSIVGNFFNAVYFQIDPSSEIYSSPQFRIIKNEFDKRKIILTVNSNYLNITELDNERIRTEIENNLNRLGNGKSIKILLNARQFDDLIPLWINLRKKGNKFIHLSETIEREF